MNSESYLQAAVEKELHISERFYKNLENTSGWRMAAVYINAGHCRKSLKKAFALQGKSGHIFFDLWVYLTFLAPWIVPIIVIPTAFASLVGGINKLLSKEIMTEKTVSETVTVPFLKYFEKEITIEKIIMVPDIEQPDIIVCQGIAVAILFSGFLLFSYTSKWFFVRELRYRRRLLLRSVKKARASKYSAIKMPRSGLARLNGTESAKPGRAASPAADS